MQEDVRLIVDLVTVLGVAAIGGVLAAVLRQPSLLGYLLGGMVVGPFGFGLIKEVVAGGNASPIWGGVSLVCLGGLSFR